MRVLALSDTHGLLRPEVLPLVAQADAVLHAGDVGTLQVLEALRAASPGPVHAVRGNVDRTPPLSELPETALLELGGVWVYLLHDLNDLDLSPVAAGVRVVISGHTHQPRREEQEGVLFLNPGSVGPRRFRLPVACAWLRLERGRVRAEPVTLAL
ncbi:metallophosphoesterase family protein [Deinococcus sp. MIMF12]|uniref:Phosphoesterase n=1 Tax=Deinococcus rhizophilus TaxID=3049544 RepID=A0ABT7JI43_9DEIO|nr:metallophosphoesterase family protein [Deinococcus rhizophilus]MDL2344606.1 metallophosphoesterase family protein [Deinococcus rhizophilus]